MGATRSLQMPPLLRVNPGSRLRWLYITTNGPPLPLNGSSNLLVAAVSPLHNALIKRRGYATENAIDIESHGSQDGSQISATTLTPFGPEHRDMIAFYRTADPMEINDKDQLAALLDYRVRNRTADSHRRRRYREYIRQARDSTEPLVALRQIVEKQPITYGPPRPAKGTTSILAPPAKKAVSNAAVALNSTQKLKVSKRNKAMQPPIIDLEYVQHHQPLPVENTYPGAPSELFRPDRVSVAINTASQKLGISSYTEVDYSSRPSPALPGGRTHVHACTLKVFIPNVSKTTATGEGYTRQSAKHAAWLLVVSKLHVAGKLKELFLGPRQKSPATTATSNSETSKPERDSELDKDAKLDIYNYAAGFGMIPTFHTTRSGSLYSVNITLLGHDIDVTATDKDSHIAELAACSAFKEQAEQKRNTADYEESAFSSSPFRVLNTETATQFFDFYATRHPGMNVEVEYDQVVGSTTSNTACLAVNGEVIGEVVTMASKRKAESVAYLAAAVELAGSRPDLLDDFVDFKKRKGKVLKPLDPIDLTIEYEALQTMQQALIDARTAGLPDVRQTLEAEPTNSDGYSSRPARSLSSAERELANAMLLSRRHEFNSRPDLEELCSQKADLPMNHHRQDVRAVIGANQYSIIVGATGSGKTTQVPQILFEDAIINGTGSSCNIICTQPRRIAATSVARRVATERKEDLRECVGYHVRFDASLPREPYGITYCTTGVLLERLKHGADVVLDGISHIIVDEVHERDRYIDYLLIVLKRAIRLRQAQGRSTPKVILMSATLDANLFANYLEQKDSSGNPQPCPVLQVPGRTFPVKEQYLGSIMGDLFANRGSELQSLLEEDDKSEEYLKLETEFSASQSQEASKPQSQPVIDWKRERRETIESEEDALRQNEKDEALVPTALVAAMIAHICSTSHDGAVLTFLPGMEEILEVKKLLLQQKRFSVDFADESKFQICLLHSLIPAEEQDVVFQPARGRRKIILSTNIAETSVTVPDVKHVVDTGKLRESRHDQIRRITKLQCVWESTSNLKQRAGRAGRVSDGFYYGLFSKERADSLRPIGTPELLRSDLQETCLSVEAQSFGEPVASFLSQAIEPPPRHAIDAAMSSLVQIGALNSDERLTPLGRTLSRLPVHPTLGKMILLGIIFKCLDPMILLGAAAEQRPLFSFPTSLRADAHKAHRSYTGESCSDHIAFLKAFEELRVIKKQLGAFAARQRAHEHFLHMGAFRTIEQTAEQIVEILETSGLVRKQTKSGATFGPSELNHNATNFELITALFLAGVHPNLAAKMKGVRCRTASEPRVVTHASSINSEARKANGTYSYGALFTYSTLTLGTIDDTVFMREITPVTPLMAALFGGELRMTGQNRLDMDGWLPMNVCAPFWNTPEKLILEFRKALDRVLNGAFASLAGIDGKRESGWADDPIREKFASQVADVLQGTVVPPKWRCT